MCGLWDTQIRILAPVATLWVLALLVAPQASAGPWYGRDGDEGSCEDATSIIPDSVPTPETHQQQVDTWIRLCEACGAKGQGWEPSLSSWSDPGMCMGEAGNKDSTESPRNNGYVPSAPAPANDETPSASLPNASRNSPSQSSTHTVNRRTPKNTLMGCLDPVISEVGRDVAVDAQNRCKFYVYLDACFVTESESTDQFQILGPGVSGDQHGPSIIHNDGEHWVVNYVACPYQPHGPNCKASCPAPFNPESAGSIPTTEQSRAPSDNAADANPYPANDEDADPHAQEFDQAFGSTYSSEDKRLLNTSIDPSDNNAALGRKCSEMAKKEASRGHFAAADALYAKAIVSAKRDEDLTISYSIEEQLNAYKWSRADRRTFIKFIEIENSDDGPQQSHVRAYEHLAMAADYAVSHGHGHMSPAQLNEMKAACHQYVAEWRREIVKTISTLSKDEVLPYSSKEPDKLKCNGS